MTNETLRLEGVTKRYRRAEAEALAAYARVLLCSNEFIYVD